MRETGAHTGAIGRPGSAERDGEPVTARCRQHASRSQSPGMRGLGPGARRAGHPPLTSRCHPRPPWHPANHQVLQPRRTDHGGRPVRRPVGGVVGRAPPADPGVGGMGSPRLCCPVIGARSVHRSSQPESTCWFRWPGATFPPGGSPRMAGNRSLAPFHSYGRLASDGSCAE